MGVELSTYNSKYKVCIVLQKLMEREVILMENGKLQVLSTHELQSSFEAYKNSYDIEQKKEGEVL